MFKTLIAWAKEFRLLFLVFVVLPVTQGAVIAYHYDPAGFSVFYFALSIVAILLLHAGTIAFNDYFDYRSGNDVVNKERTIFSGGSGLLPNVLNPLHVLAAGVACFVLCIAIGLYIVAFRSQLLLPIGIIGVIMGAFYSAPPLKLSYRFLGEAAWFLSIPLMALGSFLVLVPVNSLEMLSGLYGTFITVIVASLPLAFMGTVGIYILEFPDYAADRAVGKWNFMSIFGKKNGILIFLALSLLSYVSLIGGMALQMIPLKAAYVFLTLPLIGLASWGLVKYPGGAKGIVQFITCVIVACIITGVVMILAFL